MAIRMIQTAVYKHTNVALGPCSWVLEVFLRMNWNLTMSSFSFLQFLDDGDKMLSPRHRSFSPKFRFQARSINRPTLILIKNILFSNHNLYGLKNNLYKYLIIFDFQHYLQAFFQLECLSNLQGRHQVETLVLQMSKHPLDICISFNSLN